MISKVCKKSLINANINCFVLFRPKYTKQKKRDKGKVTKNNVDIIQNLIKLIFLKPSFSFTKLFKNYSLKLCCI